MNRIGLLLLAFFLFLSPCFSQDQTSPGAKFSDLFGEVSVRANAEDDDAYEFAELDMTLNHNDRIRTKAKSGAIISFADLSTFVMKADSVIVLDTANAKESKINLIAGNIWVNVKKIVEDGNVDIEMTQAVAGIKGTNITCSTSRGEDRIQVLRGVAEVLIKESRETVTVAEGEELIVKSGGKTEKVEIDVTAEQKKWEEQTSRMGESIQLNEVPEILKGIIDSESEIFKGISDTFAKLVSLEKVESVDAHEIAKDAERFVGVLLEDSLILASLRRKIDAHLALPDLTASDRIVMVNLLKQIAAVFARQSSYQAEVTKIMRYKFKLSAISEELTSEIESLRTEIAQATGEVDAVKAILSSNPSGMSQEWFKESAAACAQALANLDELAQKVSDLLAQNPADSSLQALIKTINDQRSAIATMIRSLTVVEINTAQITEMQQTDDVLSSQMVSLQSEISAYGSLPGSTSAEKERRLQSSIKIMSSFSRVRRLYVNSQRLYDSITRSSSGSSFKTSEQEEIENLWQNISDRFQQLGIVSAELESNVKDLESQLSTFLK